MHRPRVCSKIHAPISIRMLFVCNIAQRLSSPKLVHKESIDTPHHLPSASPKHTPTISKTTYSRTRFSISARSKKTSSSKVIPNNPCHCSARPRHVHQLGHVNCPFVHDSPHLGVFHIAPYSSRPPRCILHMHKTQLLGTV